MPQSELYLDIDVKSMKAQVLVNSGCGKSVIPLQFVPSATLRKTNIQLSAANECHGLGTLWFYC
jgi:hypothetical protein